MQVLVALAGAAGEPVSREALIDRCWRGMAVSEDALNRCVQRLRRLIESEASGSFDIETLPRIGYRLVTLTAQGDRPSRPAAGDSRWTRGPRLWVPVAAVLLCLAGAFGGAWTLRPRHWVVEHSERLISTPLIERHPAISPDGAMIAYSAGADTVSRHILVKRISGGEPIRLTNDGYDDVAPAWSPDSARIAYVAYRDGTPCRIMMVSARGGPSREVARCHGEERSHLTWARAADALFFVDSAAPGGFDRIVRLDLTDGRRTDLTHGSSGGDESEPAVSPDGRWIAFPRGLNDKSGQLIIHDLATGAERVVAPFDMSNSSFAWADDSRALFTVQSERRGSEIVAFPIDGGRPALVSATIETLGRISSGPKGLLAAEVFMDRTNAAKPPERNGAPPTVIDPANGETWSLAYSPAGALAMASDRSGECALWLKPPTEAPARLFKRLPGTCGMQLSWSPDGGRLAFHTLQRGRTALQVISAGGADLLTVTVPASSLSLPAWSSDGKSLLFGARDARGWRLWRLDLIKPSVLTPISDYGWITVQTKGADLYGVRIDRPGIWRLGPRSALVTSKLPKEQPYAWQIFGDEVVFNDSNDPTRQRLLAAPLSNGPDRIFAHTPNSAYDLDFAIDPRTGTVAYITMVAPDSDIALFRLARR
jgi:Tol biopolymer transport system component